MDLITGALPKLDEPLKFALKQKDKDYWDKEHALFGQNDYIGNLYLKENFTLNSNALFPNLLFCCLKDNIDGHDTCS